MPAEIGLFISASQRWWIALDGGLGGEGGIRTPDTVTRMPHFECGAFNHSATSPWPQQAQTAMRRLCIQRKTAKQGRPEPA
jgi:hypothetical protein